MKTPSEETAPVQKLFTEAEAAPLLGLSARTLRSLRTEGHIRYIRVSPRKIVYSEALLAEFIERHTVEVRLPPPTSKGKAVGKRR